MRSTVKMVRGTRPASILSSSDYAPAWVYVNVCPSGNTLPETAPFHLGVTIRHQAHAVLFPHAQCRPTGVYLLQTRTGVRENAIFDVQQ